jgi:hypothetical protein
MSRLRQPPDLGRQASVGPNENWGAASQPDWLTSRHINGMSGHMRTTVRLDGALLDRARKEAKRRGITLTALIEEGLKLAMRRPLKAHVRAAVELPVSPAQGGTLPGVDLDNSAALLDRMERPS